MHGLRFLARDGADRSMLGRHGEPRGLRWAPAWAVVVLLVLAGCVGGGGVAEQDDVADPDKGVIRGRVLAEDLSPVADGLVGLDDAGVATTTAEDGTFRIDGVAPGTHEITVQGIGFVPQSKSVAVAAGETAEVQFTLAPAPVEEPYVEQLIFTGYEVCTLVLGVFVFGPPTIPCTEEAETAFPVAVEGSWRYLVAELDWETSDSMWFLVVEEAGSCHTSAETWCWNRLGTAPLRIEGGPDDAGNAGRYALDAETTLPNGSFEFFVDSSYGGMFRDTINGTAGDQCNLVLQAVLGAVGQQWNPTLGCGLGYGYSTGVRIDYYVSIFHWEKPADVARYSGMPDA